MTDEPTPYGGHAIPPKLYLLSRNDDDLAAACGSNETVSVVVRSRRPGDARLIAAKAARDEGGMAWTNHQRSTCVCIGLAAGEFTEGIVLADFSGTVDVPLGSGRD